jgi:hypothetical protein
MYFLLLEFEFQSSIEFVISELFGFTQRRKCVRAPCQTVQFGAAPSSRHLKGDKRRQFLSLSFSHIAAAA